MDNIMKNTLPKNIDDRLSAMNIVILGPLHKNYSGNQKSIKDLSVRDFDSRYFTYRDFCNASLVIYSDENGTRVLKSRYDNKETIEFLKHMGVQNWTY